MSTQRMPDQVKLPLKPSVALNTRKLGFDSTLVRKMAPKSLWVLVRLGTAFAVKNSLRV